MFYIPLLVQHLSVSDVGRDCQFLIVVTELYGLTRVLWVGYAHKLQCTLHVGSDHGKTVQSGGVLADSHVPFYHCVCVVIARCAVVAVNCSRARIPTTSEITYNIVFLWDVSELRTESEDLLLYCIGSWTLVP